MLHADLENERETVANYRQRIRQAEAMGEFALSETLLRHHLCRSRSTKLICAMRLASTCPSEPVPNGRLEEVHTASKRI